MGVKRVVEAFDIDNINAVADFCQKAIELECMTEEGWERFVDRIKNTNKEGRVPTKGHYKITVTVEPITSEVDE